MSAEFRPAMPMPLPRAAWRGRERALRMLATALAAVCALVAVAAVTALTLTLGLT